MNENEIKELIKGLKTFYKKNNPDASEEEIEHMILDVFFKAYCENRMDKKDLSTLTNALGYRVKEDIIDQIEKEKKEGKKND